MSQSTTTPNEFWTSRMRTALICGRHRLFMPRNEHSYRRRPCVSRNEYSYRYRCSHDITRPCNFHRPSTLGTGQYTGKIRPTIHPASRNVGPLIQKFGDNLPGRSDGGCCTRDPMRICEIPAADVTNFFSVRKYILSPCQDFNTKPEYYGETHSMKKKFSCF